jgi:hypothetical protein
LTGATRAPGRCRQATDRNNTSKEEEMWSIKEKGWEHNRETGTVTATISPAPKG